MSATQQQAPTAGISWRSRVGSLVSMLFVVSGVALIAPATSALAACEDGSVLPTLKLRMWAEDSRYGLGEVARVHVKVNREVEGRDLGPAEGAEVTLQLASKDTYLFGGAMTDAKGKALMKVRIARHMQLGLADAQAVATKKVANGPCLRISESGHQVKKGFLRIVL